MYTEKVSVGKVNILNRWLADIDYPSICSPWIVNDVIRLMFKTFYLHCASRLLLPYPRLPIGYYKFHAVLHNEDTVRPD